MRFDSSNIVCVILKLIRDHHPHICMILLRSNRDEDADEEDDIEDDIGCYRMIQDDEDEEEDDIEDEEDDVEDAGDDEVDDNTRSKNRG